jgi:hypothetical protein
MKRACISFLTCAILACSVATVAQNAVPNQRTQPTAQNEKPQNKQSNPPKPAPTPPAAETERDGCASLQYPTAEERNKTVDENKSETDWWSRISNIIMAIGTVALAVIGAIAARIAINTLRYIGVQTRHAGIAAKAARDSVQAIVDSERPWLLIPSGVVYPEIENPILIVRLPGEFRVSYCDFKLKNFGRSPARVIETKLRLVLGDTQNFVPDISLYESKDSAEDDYTFPQGEVLQVQASLGGDGRMTMHERDELLVTKKSSLWLCGYFKYTNTFNREKSPIHTSRICYKWMYDAPSVLDSDIHKTFWVVGGPIEYNKAT